MVWERVKGLYYFNVNSLTLFTFVNYRAFNPFPNKPLFLRVCSTSLFENTVGKGEIACHEQFLLFAQCFLSAIFIKYEVGVCKVFQFGCV